MAFIAATNAPRRVIDLRGPFGNAYSLMATALRLSPKVGLSPDIVIEEMRHGDYPHLVQVFDKYFGCVVDLVVPPGDLAQLHN